jgi:hypothetical protein
MKTVHVSLAAVMTMVVSCLANDMAITNEDTFAPSTYIRYQKYPLPADQLDKALAGGTKYVDRLLDTIEAPMPDEGLWVRKSSLLAGSTGITDAVRGRLVANERHYSERIFSAETLKRLVDHDVHFTTGQVDRIVRALDHGDPSVVQGLHDALVQTFGIWFVEGAQWVYKPESVRRKYKDAWRKFWNQNRLRYGKNLPLIVNDLCLETTPIRTNAVICLQVVITNYGTNDWDLITEVPGAMKMESPFRQEEWQRVFVLIVDGKNLYPAEPLSYVVSMSPHPFSPAQMRSLPDRAVHLQSVRIPSGQRYTYLLNLSEAFPKTNLLHQDIVLSYRTWETDIRRPLWRGELRSNAVRLE